MTRSEQSRRYYECNCESIKARVRAQTAAHPEVRKAYVEKNRTRINELNREWRERNDVQWKQIAKRSTAKYKERLRREFVEAYGGKCACCGIDEKEFLTADHIGGGGAAERRALGWRALGTSFYLHLKKQGWPKDRYRLLCMNCNFATRHGKTCPHQRKLEVVPEPAVSMAMEG